MKDKLEFKIILGIRVLILFIASAIILSFLFFPKNRTEITFVATVIGVGCALYSAFYVGYGIKLQLHMKKLDNSFAFLEKYDKLDFTILAPYLHESFNPDSIAPADFYNTIKKDSSLFSAIRLRYNFFEDLSLAIQYGYVEEKVVYDSMNNILELHCDKFEKWVNGHKDLFPYPTELYMETRKLKNAWKDLKFLSNGKRIPK